MFDRLRRHAAAFLAIVVIFAALAGAVIVFPATALAADNGQSMYRMYNPNSGEHFYTASTNERDNLGRAGWAWEGIGWTAPKSSKTPVYRLYSGTDHHYTTSAAERDNLKKAGWRYEGIGWYSDDAKGVPLYRQYNPNVNPKAKHNNSGSHNYTTSKDENDQLVRVGWRAEGIGWYGLAQNSNSDNADDQNNSSNNDNQDLSLATVRSDMLKEINKQRTAAKACIVQYDDRLNKLAQAKAKDLYETGVFSHDSSNLGNYQKQLNNAGVGYMAAGENIAMGYGSVAAAMNGWMNSSGHKANILNTSFTYVGIGYYKGYWVQQFALLTDISVYCDRCKTSFKPGQYIYFSKDDDGYTYPIYQHAKCAKMKEKCPLCNDGFFDEAAGIQEDGGTAYKCDQCGHARDDNPITKCKSCGTAIDDYSAIDTREYLLTFNSYCRNTEADALVSHYSETPSYYFQQQLYRTNTCSNCGEEVATGTYYKNSYEESLSELIADLNAKGKDPSRAAEDYVTWKLK